MSPPRANFAGALGLALLPSLLAADSEAAEGPAPAGLEAALARRTVALVIGVDQYTADPGIGGLRFAGADAEAMAELLEAEGYEVSRLVGAPTRAELWRRFQAVTATLQRDDLLLIYFAGHAQLQPDAQASGLQLLLSDAVAADAWSGVSLNNLRDAIHALPVRQRVVVIDACYSRASQTLLQTANRAPVGAARLPTPTPFEAWLYAAAPAQSAQEDAALGHGVFTHFLLEGLRGAADLDGDGQVGVLELHSYAGARTAHYTGYVQVPRIAEDHVGWQDLTLVGQRSEPTEAILPWLEAQLPSWQVWIDGAPRGPGSLPPGRHAVELRGDHGETRSGEVDLRPGEALQIDPDAWLAAAAPRTRDPSAAPRARPGPDPGQVAPTKRMFSIQAIASGSLRYYAWGLDLSSQHASAKPQVKWTSSLTVTTAGAAKQIGAAYGFALSRGDLFFIGPQARVMFEGAGTYEIDRAYTGYTRSPAQIRAGVGLNAVSLGRHGFVGVSARLTTWTAGAATIRDDRRNVSFEGGLYVPLHRRTPPAPRTADD